MRLLKRSSMKAIKAFVCRPRSWWKRLGTYFCVALIYALPIITIPGFAAIYLKIEGVEGEAITKGHEKWIEVSSLQWGVGRSVTLSGGTNQGSLPNFSEVVFTKPTDKTTPFFFLEAAQGKGKEVSIDFTQPSGTSGEQIYYQITLSDVLVSGFSQSSGGDRPTESIALNFSKIKMTYTPYSPTGIKGTPVSAEYDLTTNKGQ